MASTECRSCHAEIDYAEKSPAELNDKGLPKMVPVNHDSVDDPKGNLEVWSAPVIDAKGNVGPATVLYFRYLRQGQQPAEGHHRGISHFATCPDRKQWRS